MPYYLSDVHAAMRKITAACPDVRLENWGDFGFLLEGYKRDAQLLPIWSTMRIIFRPARPEIGQTEIIADVDALIKEWSS